MKTFYFLLLSLFIFIHANGRTFNNQPDKELLLQENIVNGIPLAQTRITELQDKENELFFLDQRDLIKRFGKIVLNETLKQYMAVEKGDKIILNLFENQYQGVVHSTNKDFNGTISVTARIEGYDSSFMVMTTSGKRSMVTIYLTELMDLYRVISTPDGDDHYLVQMDLNDLEKREPGQVIPPPIFDQQQLEREQQRIRQVLSQKDPGPDDPATIDLMVIYTPAALSWADASGGGIQNVIAQGIAIAQLVCDNSQTLLTWNLVYSGMVNYVESGSMYTDLVNFSFENGIIDEVQTLRDLHNADLSTFFCYLPGGSGGNSWLLNDVNGLPHGGYSVVRTQDIPYTFYLIHELGHNLGGHHSKEQEYSPGPTVWTGWPENTWSAGWRWTGNDQQNYSSVMSYEWGYPDGEAYPNAPYFSNPQVSHQGVPTGHPTGGDNTRTIKITKHIVAAYRPLPPPSLVISDQQHDFGTIETGNCTGHFTFFIYNEGGTPAQGTVSLQDNTHFEITWGAGDFFIEPDQTIAVDVRFCPQSPGLKTTQLILSDMNQEPFVQATLTGTGQPLAGSAFLDIKVALEGAFSYNPPSIMTTNLLDNLLLPAEHPFYPTLPYFGNTDPLWLYDGNEAVSDFHEEMVDWVLLELRDAPSAGQATSATIIARQAAVLLENGAIVNFSGEIPYFNLNVQHDLFVVVYHRNHLPVMSALALPLQDFTYHWDFTQSQENAYLDGQKPLGQGIYGMYGGDGDANGQVQTQDKNNVWEILAGENGYLPSDFDMNGQVQTQDKNEVWEQNAGTATQVP